MGRLHLYRNISIVFIVVAAMILVAVFLLFYSQATIVITPDAQTVNLNLSTEIRPSSTPAELAKLEAIGGSISMVTRQVEEVFNTSSTRAASASISVGRVRISSVYSNPQKLVKTTQLQASNGVIVRTDSEVTVPANGSVEVGVYPKDLATFQPIASGKLIIIKLLSPLREKIFGEVIEPLNLNNSGEVYYLADSDVSRAKKELVAKAVSDALNESSSSDANIKGDLVSFTIDKKLGDEAKTFTMRGVVKLKTIIADEEQLAALIKSKVQKMDLNGLAADSIDLSQVHYTVLDTSNSDNIPIKVTYPVKAYLTTDNSLLARGNFTGKTAEEIRDYAAKTGIIKNIEVIISPYWRDTTPQDENRIKIIIQ